MNVALAAVVGVLLLQRSALASVPCVDNDACLVTAVQSSSAVPPQYKPLLSSCSVLADPLALQYCSSPEAASIAECCPLTCGAVCTNQPTPSPTFPDGTIAPTPGGRIYPKTSSFCAYDSARGCQGEQHYFERISRYYGRWNPCATNKVLESAGGLSGFATMCETNAIMNRSELQNFLTEKDSAGKRPGPFHFCSAHYLRPAHSVCDSKEPGGTYSTTPLCAARRLSEVGDNRSNVNLPMACHLENPFVDLTPCSIDPLCNITDTLGVSFPAIPYAADIDGDGDIDFLIGAGMGRVHYFENVGDRYSASFVERRGADHPFDGGDSGDVAADWAAGEHMNNMLQTAPTMFDGDGDNILDVILGERFGRLLFKKGRGDGTFMNATCTSFTTADRLADPGCPDLIARINSTLRGKELCYTSMVFSDINGDDVPDLILSGAHSDDHSVSLTSGCRLSKNAVSFTGASAMGRTFVHIQRNGVFELLEDGKHPFANIYASLWSVMSFGDVDGDGTDELFVGTIEITSSSLVWYSKQPAGPHEYGGFGYSWESNYPIGGGTASSFMDGHQTIPSMLMLPQVVDLDGDGLNDLVVAALQFDQTQPAAQLSVKMVWYRHIRPPDPIACTNIEVAPQCGYDRTVEDAADRFPGTCAKSSAAAQSQCACSVGRAGTFNRSAPKLGCKECVPGRAASAPGQTACTVCGAGLFASRSGSDECGGRCKQGSYSSETGLSSADQCTPCPQGTYSAETGVGAKGCGGKCDIGKYGVRVGAFNSTTCEKCPKKHVAITGQSSCTKCETGFLPDTYNVYCKACPDFTFLSRDDKCVHCPANGVTCIGGKFELERGTWYARVGASGQRCSRAANATDMAEGSVIHACFNSESCRVCEPDQMSFECAIEKGYFGPLCGACDADNVNGEGVFTRSGSVCLLCWPSWLSWLAFVGVACGLFFAMLYLVDRHNFSVELGEYDACVQKIALSHIQMLGVLGIFRAQGTRVFNDLVSRPSEIVGGSFMSVLPIKCALESQIYGPFLLNMALPLLGLGLAALLLIPKTLVEQKKRVLRSKLPMPSFQGRGPIPDALAVCKVLRKPTSQQQRAEWQSPFFPSQRFSGVAVFVIFTLYPTLVMSIASIFKCTDPIEGKTFLFADLTVECFRGYHIGAVSVACVGAVVYAAGIPLAVAFVTYMKSPIAKKDDGSPRCVCARRERDEYSKPSVRSRYAFLYNGYSTNRGVVVAWEALVMLRKLAVTLAGSVISDPYLQILVALLILVVSALTTAFVQPYETRWLNLLDTIGLFALIATQILSIAYFYAENTHYPFMDRAALEISVTGLLILLNTSVLLVFFCCWVSELLGLRAWYTARHSVALRVASPAEAEAALAVGARANKDVVLFWRHPSNIAVKVPPTLTDLNVWVWQDAENGVTASTSRPELLELVVEGVPSLPTGTDFCWMNIETRVLSVTETTVPDTGGWEPCSRTTRDAPPLAQKSLAMAMMSVSSSEPEADVMTRWGGSTVKRDNPLAPSNALLSAAEGGDITVLPVEKSELEAVSVRVSVRATVRDPYVFSDYDGVVHGPFSSVELLEWYDHEQLAPETPVAIAADCGSEEAATAGGEWTTLNALAAEVASHDLSAGEAFDEGL